MYMDMFVSAWQGRAGCNRALPTQIERRSIAQDLRARRTLQFLPVSLSLCLSAYVSVSG